MSNLTGPQWPQLLPLEYLLEGDTWLGFEELSVQIDGAAPLSALALVEVRFQKDQARAGVPVVLSSTAAAQVMITDAAGWKVKIPKQIIAGLTAGKWRYQIAFTAADNERQTYYQGELLVAAKI
jgi:hypothetical protein